MYIILFIIAFYYLCALMVWVSGGIRTRRDFLIALIPFGGVVQNEMKGRW